MFSLESRTATAPAWCGVLNAAKSWGVPPWDIVRGSKLLWYMRQKAVDDALMEHNQNGK